MPRTREDKKGKKYGRLTVLEHDQSDPSRYVICKCDCGTVKRVRIETLVRAKNPVRSCGCIRRETGHYIGTTYGFNGYSKIDEMRKTFGTNFGIIERKTLNKRNKSGHTGVCYNVRRGRYEAYISNRGRQIHLGFFEKYDDAVKERERAEELYYHPLIAAKNEAFQLATT